MAKIGGVARNVATVEISNEDFAALQQISGLQFPKSFKVKFEENIYFYIFKVAIDSSSADTREIIRFLQSISNRARAFIDVIEKVDSEIDYVGKYQALGWIFSGKDGKSTKNQDALINEMKAVLQSSDRYIASIKENHGGSPGRNPSALNILFLQTGVLFEQAGGTATAYWSEHDRDGKSGGQEGSVFVDFVYALIELIPSEYRPKAEKGPGKGADLSRKALAARITRWREDTLAAQKRAAG